VTGQIVSAFTSGFVALSCTANAVLIASCLSF